MSPSSGIAAAVVTRSHLARGPLAADRGAWLTGLGMLSKAAAGLAGETLPVRSLITVAAAGALFVSSG